MADIKDRWNIYKLERANAKNKKMLENMGVSKKQIKSQSALMSELGKKLSSKNNGVDSKNEVSDKKLKKVSVDLKNTSKFVEKKLKEVVPCRLSREELLKNAKSIINSYCDVYKNFVIGNSEKCWMLSAEYELAPVDRFNPQSYRKVFDYMESATKKIVFTRHSLKKLFQQIAKCTGQKVEKWSDFTDPGLYFVRCVQRAELPLTEIAKLIGDNFEIDKDKSIRLVRQHKAEAEEVAFRKFSIVDCDLLEDENRRNEYKNNLANFMAEWQKMLKEFVNKLPADGSEMSGKLCGLVRMCW